MSMRIVKKRPATKPMKKYLLKNFIRYPPLRSLLTVVQRVMGWQKAFHILSMKWKMAL